MLFAALFSGLMGKIISIVVLVTIGLIILALVAPSAYRQLTSKSMDRFEEATGIDVEGFIEPPKPRKLTVDRAMDYWVEIDLMLAGRGLSLQERQAHLGSLRSYLADQHLRYAKSDATKNPITIEDQVEVNLPS